MTEWRREWDSNPRYAFCAYTPLAGARLRPARPSLRKQNYLTEPSLVPHQLSRLAALSCSAIRSSPDILSGRAARKTVFCLIRSLPLLRAHREIGPLDRFLNPVRPARPSLREKHFTNGDDTDPRRMGQKTALPACFQASGAAESPCSCSFLMRS